VGLANYWGTNYRWTKGWGTNYWGTNYWSRQRLGVKRSGCPIRPYGDRMATVWRPYGRR